MIAYRYVSNVSADETPVVGCVLAPSSIWSGDEPTDERLAGTCGFASLAACLEYAQWSTGTIIAIEGRRVRNSRRNRRVAGEVVIAGAVVVAISHTRASIDDKWTAHD